jgi:hypothetical protein
MLNFCSIVAAILKMENGRNFSMSGINLGHHYLPTFWWYRTMLNFYRPFFMPCFGSHFENGRIAPLMVTYHYVKFYVSIIIYLEVINIWTPQNMTLTPFTTKLKTLGPTRNIYL